MATTTRYGSYEAYTFGRYYYGTEGHDSLYGSSGNDTLYSYGGYDFIDGGAGADRMYGGGGNDIYIVDNSGDAVNENANEGYDTVRASISYTLTANVERLELLEAGGATNGAGNSLNNSLYGNSYSNTLSGGAGDDRLDGGMGADSLIGGIGNDLYILDQGGDSVGENVNEGHDTVHSSVSHALGANVENLWLRGSASAGTGNSLDNQITGNSYANVLAGGGGADRIVSYDWVDSSLDHDVLDGGDHNDILIAGLGDDALIGGAGGDRLYGDYDYEAQDDTGNPIGGNDVLNGGAGADRMWGGAGGDVFVFAPGDSGIWDGADTVFDFSRDEQDRIDLSAFGFASFADVVIGATEPGFGDPLVYLELSETQMVYVQGVQPGSLTADDFIL